MLIPLPLKKIGITAALLSLAGVALFSQKTIRAVNNTSTVSRQALNSRFSNYSTYSIDETEIINYTQQQKGGRILLNLQLPGLGNWKLSLTENNLISNNYLLTTGTPEGRQTSSAPTCHTYSGFLTDAGSSSVCLTIDDNVLYGIVKKDTKQYYIEPLNYLDKESPAGFYVVYEAGDVREHRSMDCAATETSRRTEIMSRAGAGLNCVRVKLAIASDAGMYARYRSAAAVQTHNIGVMNNVQWDYANGSFLDNIEFTIVTQFVATSPAANPLTPVYAGNDCVVALTNFSAWGNGGGFGTSFDLGQLWTTRNLSDNTGNTGVVGYAWMGGLCNSFKYHILEDFTGTNPSGSAAGLRMLASHEIGHNFNLSHDPSGQYIMSPVLPGAAGWSPASISTMAAYIPTLTCLGACSAAGVPRADFTVNEAACTGSALQLTDHSLNGPDGRAWSFPGGNPSSSTARNPIVSYASGGIKTISLVASNGAGVSAIITKTVLVSNSAKTACTNPGVTTSSAGLKKFFLNNIQKISGSTATDGNRYMDFSCSDITRLMPATTYTVQTTVGDGSTGTFNGINLYIDYNNDGDFADAGELAYTTAGWALYGDFSFSFTTPASPPVVNQLLRTRIIAKDFVFADNPCAALTTGQAEDYSIYFTAASVLPVHLLDFSGRAETNGNVLTWSTAEETANSYFEIERSDDGIHFEKKGRVAGVVNSTTIQQYSFFDVLNHSTGAKKYYYRLKITDTDGGFEYSRIVVIEGAASHATAISVFPNPFSQQFQVRLQSVGQQKINMQLTDQAGRQVYAKEEALQTGSNQITCTGLAKLASGIYVLKISIAGEVITMKLRKQ